MEYLHVGIHGGRLTPGFDQLAPDSVLSDFVVFIQRYKDLSEVFLRKSRLLRHALEHAAVVYHDCIATNPDAVQEQRGNVDQLALCGIGGIPQNVDIALCELAEPPLLRAVCAPDRADLQRFEGCRQTPGIVGIVAGQGDGQVIPHTRVTQIIRIGSLRRLSQFFAALEHLEDKLLVLSALLVRQVLDALHAGGLNGRIAKGRIHRLQPGEQVLAHLHLGRQDIAHPLDRFFDKHIALCFLSFPESAVNHAPVCFRLVHYTILRAFCKVLFAKKDRSSRAALRHGCATFTAPVFYSFCGKSVSTAQDS